MFEFLFNYPRDDYARSELIFTGDWPLWLLVLLSTAAIAGISWFLYQRRSAVQPPQMVAIWALQVAMLALVIWVLQQPTLSTEQLRPGENAVAIIGGSDDHLMRSPDRKPERSIPFQRTRSGSFTPL